MRLKTKGYIAIAIAVIELAFLPIMIEIGASGIGNIPLAFYIFMFSSVAALAIGYRHDKLSGVKKIITSRNMLIIILITGLLNDAISQIFLGVGTLGTNPSVAAIVFRSWVIFVALLSPLVLRQRITGKQLFATILGFSSVFLIMATGPSLSLNLTQLPFIAALLIAALCATSSNLLMKVYNADPVSSVVLFNIVSFAFLGLFAISSGVNLAISLNATDILTIAFLGVVSYAIGSSLYFYALKIFGPVFMGNAILSVPFLTIAFSALTIGTPFSPIYIGAAALLSTGIILQRRFSSNAPSYISSKGRSSPSNRSYGKIYDISGAFVGNRGSEIRMSLSSTNKALAMRLPSDTAYDINGRIGNLGEYDCILFTTASPHSEVAPEEIEFINNVVGLSGNEYALVGIGNASVVEDAFDYIAGEASKKPGEAGA